MRKPQKRNIYEDYFFKNFRILVIILAIFFFTGILCGVISISVDFFWGAFLCVFFPAAVILLPLLLYVLLQYRYYHTVTLTDLQKVRLEKTVGKYRGVSFEVDVKIAGQARTMRTKAVFSIGGLLSDSTLTQYSMQTVTVGYNADRDEIVVFSL